MRPLAVILVVVAVLAAGLTAFLAKRWTDTQSAARAKAVADTVQVMVASRDIAPGTVLAETDLTAEAWPSALAVRFIGTDGKARLVGQVARRPITQGEPFAAQAGASSHGGGVLAGMLAPGARAVSVAITNASAVSGFIVPGDRVDVVLAADFQRADSQAAGKGNGAIVRYASETVLSDVKVLAVDQNIGKGKDGAAIQGKTATLEVTPKQAETLVAAGLMGQLSLVLRGAPSGTEPEAAARTPYTADTEASRAMRALSGVGATRTGPRGSGIVVNRGGAVSAQGAP